MLIVITTAITYTSYSMNQVTQLAESIGVQQEIKTDTLNESFDVVSVNIVNDQFNITVKNTGDVPVHLTRFWIENTTDPSWPVSKFDIDFSLAPGDTVKNIGQGVGLTALATQSYHSQIISERGNQKEMFLNTVGDSSIYTRVSATPAVMPTGFSTTVTLEVINTGTTQLLNLQPDMVSVTTPACTNCSIPVEEEGPSPASFDSLAPGDIALFEWIYSYSGENNDNVLFEAGILNDARTDTVLVTLQTVESSLNADIALESGGINDQDILGDQILIFHQELTGTNYQMYSGSPDGDSNGDYIELDTETPHFMTRNQTLVNSVEAGTWELALMLSSEFQSANINDIPDMIFHFEDGQDVAPVNSEGNDSRGLMGCGIASTTEDANSDSNQGHEHTDNDDVHTGDMELGPERISGIRFTTVDIDRGESINSAFIYLESKDSDFGELNLRIYGVPADGDVSAFQNGNDEDISERTLTSNYVDWINVADWSSGEDSADTTTPDISSIISEITSHGSWDNGDNMVILFFDHPDFPSQEQRKAKKPSDSSYNDLIFAHGSGVYPTWVPDSGPHGSASVLFDGSTECLKSVRPSHDDDDNDILGVGNSWATTSVWFKTTDNDADIAEDMYLVNWHNAAESEEEEHYRLLLTAGSGSTGGRVEASGNNHTTGGSSEKWTITSTNDYDDQQWYNAIIQAQPNDDEVHLRVYDVAGNLLYNNFNNDNEDSQEINVNGYHWRVGSNSGEDGNFFKGYIDDVMHWDDIALTDGEQDDLVLTNYGDGAHQFNVYVDITDDEGLNPVNIYSSATPLQAAFADPKSVSLSNEDDDFTYTQVNMTIPMAQVDLIAQERLDVYFSWVGSTSSWEALEVDMKIDDSDIASNVGTTSYSSFLFIPPPDEPFPTYFDHSPTDEFVLYVVNTGNDGIFLTYQGSRISFNGTNGSYAGLVNSVNGTGTTGTPENDPSDSCSTHCWWSVDQDHDSLHIPKGERGLLYFHPATDVPSNDQTGNLMVDGMYDTTVWLNGYSDQGETFLRSIMVGSVEVVTP